MPSAAAAGSALERAVAPLDGMRRAFFAPVRRRPWLLRWAARREPRLALIATAHALVALVIAIFAPVILIVLGPIVLGVPHVASDVRYLVLRRALPSWWRRAVWIGCGALIALRLGEELAPGLLPGGRLGFAELEILAVLCWVVGAAIAGSRARGSWRRMPWVVLPVAGLAALGLAHPIGSRLVFAHLHNLVAIGIWLALFRRRPLAALVPLLVILGGVALLMSGAVFGLTLAHPALLSFAGLHLLAASDWLAPGLPVVLAVGLTATYAYLQSVHYAVWLIYVPQEDVRSEGTLTFRMSMRSLFRDFGGVALAGLVLLALVVAALAIGNPLRARALYLSLATFHGYLEIAMLAFFLTRAGGLPRAGAERPVPAAA